MKRKSQSSTHPNIPWKEMKFERLTIKAPNDKTTNVAKCLICNKVLQNVGYKRLSGHRNTCKEQHQAGGTVDISQNEEINQASTSSEQGIDFTTRHKKNSEDSTTDKEKGKSIFDLSEIDESLGFFVFACGIPFSTVESKHFLNFVKKLNPEYKPPTRRTLSENILDKVYQKIIKTTSFEENTNSVLLLNGWKNSSKNEKYVVGTIHNANGVRLFLNAWDFTQESETALNLSKVVEEATIDAKEKYNVNVYAVVSDNVSSMMSMGKMISQWHATCNSHSGNLLAKSIVDSSFNEKVVKVLKLFKTSSFERELIKLGGCRIVLPGETRWCSIRDAYRCLLRNLIYMRNIVVDEKMNGSITPQVIGLVLDEDFERKFVALTINFDGICELINKCQKSDFNIADALEEWLKLEFPLHDEEIESALESRLKKVVTPMNLVANILHPVYQGKRFSKNESYNQMAKNFLNQNLDQDGLKSLSDYENKIGIFNTLFQKEIKCPHTFWTFAEQHHLKLSQLSKKLMRIPSSTAAIERLFSQWAYIHNKIRNRLSCEKSKKLIHCYYTLKLDDYDFVDDNY